MFKGANGPLFYLFVMKRLEHLKELKEMYEMELDDIHVYEGDPRIKDLREASLHYSILMFEDEIRRLERKKIKIITAVVAVVVALFIVYLIF